MDTSKSSYRVKGGILFKHPTLEKLTKTNALFAIYSYQILSIGLLTYILVNDSSPITGLLNFFAGIISFTLLEYIMHRFLYHLHLRYPWAEKVQYTIHGVHHQHPNDADRQAMPLILSIPLIGIISSISFRVSGAAGLTWFAGLLMGYSLYLLIHFSVHTRRMPKGKLRFWWKYHNVHHYKEPNKAYGVSSPIWDIIFGTYPSDKYRW